MRSRETNEVKILEVTDSHASEVGVYLSHRQSIVGIDVVSNAIIEQCQQAIELVSAALFLRIADMFR